MRIFIYLPNRFILKPGGHVQNAVVVPIEHDPLFLQFMFLHRLFAFNRGIRT